MRTDAPAIIITVEQRIAAAVHAQAARPGCANPNRVALWCFREDAGDLAVVDVPSRRFRSLADEASYLRSKRRRW